MRQQPDTIPQRSRAERFQRAPEPGARSRVFAWQGKNQGGPICHMSNIICYEANKIDLLSEN
jgi:hypothetical protein